MTDAESPAATTGRAGPERRRFRAPAIIAVAAGIALRAWQYFGDSSMWFDEIVLAKNVLGRSLWGLVSQPLNEGYVATAPPGFLIVEKTVTTAFGTSDLAFRLWPFVASVAALLLFWRLATHSQRPIGALVSVALFALASPLVWHGAQAKQYSSDVLCTVLLLTMVQRLSATRSPERIAFVASALLGAVIVWMSQPAIFVLFATGLWLLGHAWRSGWLTSRSGIGDVALVGGAWAVSSFAAVMVATAMISSELAAVVYPFWSVGFPPDGASVTLLKWSAERWSALFGSGSPTVGGFSQLDYGSAGAPAAVALATCGAVVWLIRRHAFGVVFLLAMAATLVAAALHRYPFDNRLLLFLLPLMMLAMGEAIAALEVVPRIGPGLSVMATIAMVAVAMRSYVVNGLPVYHMSGHVKPVLTYFDSQREPGDEVYVTGLQSAPFAHYADRFGLTENGFVVGGCYLDRRSRERYLADLDQFRGKPRVWLLFSGLQRPIRDTLVTYLDANARRLDAYRYEYQRADNGAVVRVEAFLFDLSDLPTPGFVPEPAERATCPPLAVPAGRYGGPGATAQ